MSKTLTEEQIRAFAESACDHEVGAGALRQNVATVGNVILAIRNALKLAARQPEPRDEVTPLRVERHSDMSVVVVFSSCRQASVFEKEILARTGAAHE
ncbi:TPA: hypothetical protein QDC51_000996 [Burkholderia multivorans]|nr:hypothetical protein [Burkholderia multivorans]HDR9840130.1 hypothetical protein [Burkholderia multivorans]HDR9846718.1 hypothetical protein [Burkholderia multivorans]HDR9853127.1 hypothetical protein [Burkholderia multivorans]